MSDPTKPGVPGAPGSESVADQDKNIKAEFNRKIDNVEALLKQQADVLKALTQPRKAAPEPEPGEEDFNAMSWQNPKKAAELIKKQAKQEILEEIRTTSASEGRRSATLQQMANEYPETVDPNSPLTKRAEEIWKSMPEDERGTSVAIRAAVRDAAAELDIKPKSKRTPSPDVDSFSFGNSGGSSSNRRPKDEVDPATTDLVGLFGLDTSDSKIQDKIKEKSKRTDYGRYRPIGKSK